MLCQAASNGIHQETIDATMSSPYEVFKKPDTHEAWNSTSKVDIVLLPGSWSVTLFLKGT